jgi:hypothetical protein
MYDKKLISHLPQNDYTFFKISAPLLAINIHLDT